jgi:PKHD-type hydroxylase
MIRQNWQMFPKVISESIIDEIVQLASATIEASTFNDSGADIRKSRVAWINDKRILNLLYDYVDMSNRNVFNINVYKKADIQFTEYLATEGGHYNWHHDVNWNRNDGLDRKLSVTVQLSSSDEYEGGDFSFNECESPSLQLKEKGTVLVFPSYLQHKVAPVTKGTRKSLVAWFEGSKWR